MNKDSLGDRMKNDYESRSQTYLPRRTYTMLRLDGKAFHTFTKHCKRPYDLDLMSDMDETAKYLCENIQGCKLAYVQSDEISLLLRDDQTFETQPWYGKEINKICSVAASKATKAFIQYCLIQLDKNNIESYPEFDFILIMATIPGQSGGKFDTLNFAKIRKFRKLYPTK